MKISLVGSIALVILLGVAVSGQDQAPAPTFRSETNYVQLPVRVLDGRGEFVSGLTQSAFQVLEDGTPQTITAFSAVDIPIVDVDETIPDAPLAAVDPVASNSGQEVDGRVYAFVLDNLTMDAAMVLRTRQVIRGFIRDQLKANDLAAIVMSGIGRGQDFTRNRTLLNEAADRLISDTNPLDNRDGFRTRRTIADTAQWLGSIAGRRKALLLVTTSQLCPLVQLDLQTVEDGGCVDDVKATLRAAMRADVSIYTVDPRGAVADQGAPAEVAFQDPGFSPGITRGPLDAARYLAEESGGFAIVNTNSISAGLARIVRENSSYYLLGYYSSNNREDGRLRKNAVRVARPGTTVVHRDGYYAPRAQTLVVKKPGTLTSAGTAATVTVADRLLELARSPLPVSAMPLRLAAAPFLSGDGKARVIVIVEIPHEALRPATDNDRYLLNIGLSIGFYDRDGRSVAGDDPNIELDIPLNAAPKVTRNGMRVVSRVPVPPGAYRLWVGAVQPLSGLRGSVMTEIDIPDFDRQPLTLSGIALSTTMARRIYTARTDELLDDIFGAPPVAHRDFSAESDLWIYGEIYDHRTGAGDVAADVIVKSPDGTIVYRTAFEAAPVQFGHLAQIPLKELGPGSYTATIEARSDRPEPVTATRTISFRVQ